jgi:hypothetical protein
VFGSLIAAGHHALRNYTDRHLCGSNSAISLLGCVGSHVSGHEIALEIIQA